MTSPTERSTCAYAARALCVRVINTCRACRDVRIAPCCTDTRDTSRL